MADRLNTRSGADLIPELGDGEIWYEKETRSLFIGTPEGNVRLLGSSAAGVPGAKGDKGDKGDTGERGPQGEKGDTGEQGIQGLPGAKGDQGIQGLPGNDGSKGDTGDAGPQGIQGIQGVQGPAGATAYTLSVQALTSSPTDGATVYFGNLPKAPTTTANISRIYIRKSGIIKIVEIFTYSGTAGTGENWSLYIRKNNSEDTLIATVAAATNMRVFSNANLNIAINAGDYIEIKGVQPTWATNPATTIYGGYIYVE